MLTVGENFLRYKVLALIGGGGMGEVYLAKDQQLERKVAIKVLRKKFSRQNDDALERFMLEARSASALNHPNIITIYEIGESDGSPYIASEFIEGKTLHDRLAGDALSLADILNISIQIAEALTAAHTAGIVHRDIKPENVMIREDGYIKVLDFGLAKLTENGRRSVDVEADTKRMLATDPGIILGTVSYMSPEQARGRNIDARSDIWSLGVVIYEMLTGRRPFVGDTTSDVIAAILRSDPAEISTQVPDTPRSLERIVNKALRKDREERYQHIKDLLIDLKDLRRELDVKLHTDSGRVHATDGAATDEPTGDGKPGAKTDPMRLTTRSIRESLVTQFRLHPLPAILVSVLILAALVGVGYWIQNWIGRRSEADAFQTMRFARLTSAGNIKGRIVSISKDGRYVAYVVNDGGKQALWVRQTLSEGSAQVVPAANADYSGLAFSGDGTYILYTASLNDDRPCLYSVPTLGGTPRKIVEDVSDAASISPDGSQIAIVRSDYREIAIVDGDGSNLRPLAAATGGDAFNFSVWSSDGTSVYTGAYSAADSRFHLLSFSIKDGRSREVGRSWLSINGIAVLPNGAGILLAARDIATMYSQIWLIKDSSVEPVRVTNDLSNYTGVSVEGDGRTLATIQENRLINIWIADEATAAAARKITADLGRSEGFSGISWTPDGKILYTARVPAMQDIWVVDPAAGSNRQLTFNVGSNYHQTVSPDGRSVVFASDRSGNLNLWKMSIDGQNPVQMTDTPGLEAQPAFTPDGRSILYHYFDENRQVSIWKLPVDGGQPARLTDIGFERPNIAPDGRTFACRYAEGDAPAKKIAIFRIEGGQPVKLLDLPDVALSHLFHWSADGTAFVYIDTKSGFDLYSQPVAGGPPRLMVPSVADRIYAFDISRNGHGYALSRGTETSDVVIVRNF